MSKISLEGANSNTFANIFTFFGYPLSRELDGEVDVVMMGVPYDLATTARPGTRYGPTGVRQASSQLRWEKTRWPWRFALDDVLSIIDYGDLDYEPGVHSDMADGVTAEAAKILAAGKKLVTVGGDHFISLPLLRAVKEIHGQVALLHFDAHVDNEQSEGQYNHGTVFHHAEQEGLVDPASTVQVGIRTEYDYDDHPFKVLHASWCNNQLAEDIAEEIYRTVGSGPVYLSFDIDCLDPAYAPGTGTPVTGGLTTDKALQILRALGRLDIVAVDLMEVAPAYDHAEITSLAASTLLLEMLYLLASRRAV